MINGKTALFGFMAHPAKHSRSPKMHNLSFDYWHINARYLAFDVAPTDLTGAVAGIRSMGISGVNLSMPFKETVVPMLDGMTTRAKRIKAVNTIKNDHGKLIGDSTDGAGLYQNLQHQGYDLHGKNVVILGAGGAGKAIIAAALDYDVASVTVFKRANATYAQVDQWLNDLASQTDITMQLRPYDDLKAMQQAVQASDLIINATNVGMTTAGLPLPPQVMATLTPSQTVYDVIYQPLETEFLRQAKALGCATHNGLGMLIWQGALAFKFWTGKEMPIAAVTESIMSTAN